jgi:hypothetical protein
MKASCIMARLEANPNSEKDDPKSEGVSIEELVGEDGCVDVEHKTYVRAVGSIRQAKSIKRRERGFDPAMTSVKHLFTLRWRELVAFSGSHQVNGALCEVSFEVSTDITLVCGDDGVGEVFEQARSHLDIVFVGCSEQEPA